MEPHTGGKWLIQGTKRPKDNQLSCKARNYLVEYPSRSCKYDIKEYEGNMFNPVFKENVQGWKHPGNCAFTEPEQLSYRKPKSLAKKIKNGHKNPNNSHNYQNENQEKLN